MHALETKISLEPTAALVMELARRLYLETELTRNYFNRLDLSSGQKLIEAYEKGGVLELSFELMANRKFSVCKLAVDFLKNTPGMSQVIIIAAGKSPLSLELLQQANSKISKVFEVDINSFDDKKMIYSQICPEALTKVGFLQLDILSPQFITELKGAGYNPALPCVITLEGITHYIDEMSIKAVLEHFKSEKKVNAVVMEYSPPTESLVDWAKPVANVVFSSVEELCFKHSMYKYSVDQLQEVFTDLGGNVLKHYPMNVMEKMRTGENRHFKEINSGWVECITGVV